MHTIHRIAGTALRMGIPLLRVALDALRSPSCPIAFTDFPLDEITLYFANNTIYLPSEH
jgi:hypothetical protein